MVSRITLASVPGKYVLLVHKNPDNNQRAYEITHQLAMGPVWHEEQAKSAEAAKRWFAAEFHLRHLVAFEDLKNLEEIECRHQSALNELNRQEIPIPSTTDKPK